MDLSLKNRVAIVTGAGSGMGRAHARLMAERGAILVCQDIDRAGASETAEAIRAAGGKAQPAVFDIADVPAADAAFGALRDAMGRVDILVNNAGIGSVAELHQIDRAAFARMFDVHVKGSFFAAQAVVPAMKAQRSGRIINISSIWGMVGHPYASDYCGAKAALLGLTRAWAQELAPYAITVNAVAPGGVLTDMVFSQPGIEERMAAKVARVPLGRYADPREISYTVAFLASDAASFITGQTVSANGGETIVGI